MQIDEKNHHFLLTVQNQKRLPRYLRQGFSDNLSTIFSDIVSFYNNFFLKSCDAVKFSIRIPISYHERTLLSLT